MRVVVLSSASRGFAAYCLPALAVSPQISVAAVIYNRGTPTKPWLKRWRKLKKMVRIGPLGAVNGIRMRRWYDLGERLKLEPLDALASRFGIPFSVTPSLLAPSTVDLVHGANAELGLSLGNGYIPERVFSIPPLGMINVHHELLPDFQGAQSVLWQLYHGSSRTGFTIHQIDRHIDTGKIIYQETLPIVFRPTLAETVQENYARLWQASRDVLVKVVADFARYADTAVAQGAGRSFTTPSYRQYLRMVREHRRLSGGAS